MSAQTLFDDYSAFHRTRGNKICHFIGIPAIMVSLFGLLGDAGLALWLLATLWYLKLDWKLGAPFSLVALGAWFLGQAIPMLALVSLFVVGWVFQLIGHKKYEGNSPAFLDNIRHLLIGPLWIFARWTRLGPLVK